MLQLTFFVIAAIFGMLVLCSVPSFVYQIYNRFVQNGTKNDKGEDGTATINNEYVVNANTNAVLTFKQGKVCDKHGGC